MSQCCFCLWVRPQVTTCSCGECGTTFCPPEVCIDSSHHTVECDGCRALMIVDHGTMIDGYPHCADCKEECQRYSDEEKQGQQTAAA